MSVSFHKTAFAPNNKQNAKTQPQVKDENSLNNIEIDKITHWLTSTNPFISKLQNEQDRVRTAYLKKLIAEN